MVADLGTSNWAEADASNNQTPPAGWPAGMFANQVEPSARAMMGALKRLYGKANPVYTTAGTTTAYTLTSTGAAEAAYYAGQVYCFIANATCGASPTLNIDTLGAIALRKFSAGAWVACAASDIQANQYIAAKYTSGSPNYFDIVGMAFSLTDFVQLTATNAFTGTNTFAGATTFSGVTTLTQPLAGTTVRAYLGGLTTSNNAGAPNTKIDVSAGVCADSTNATMLSSAGGTIDCGTTGANGLDAGVLANSTWYHSFVIGKTDGTMALVASTSVASPTMPSGYTLKRRIGSFLTNGSANIVSYIQDGDLFQWLAPVADISAVNPGTSAVSRALTVPSGVSVGALVQAILEQNDSAVVSGYLSDLATNDVAVTSTLATMGNAANATRPTATLPIRTNTSRQIRSRLSASSASTTLTINTLGWYDRRGRDS